MTPRTLAVCLAVLFTACSAQTTNSDAAVAIDAGIPDAGTLDVGRIDASVLDGGTSDAGVHPCFFCPSGAFCASDGGCDYACGSCTSDNECGPRHRCWFRECIAHQPDCTDATQVTGIRLEVEWCSALGSIPRCQRVLELPFDGGLTTLRQEPVGAGDGGTFTLRLSPAATLTNSFLDAGFTCIDQPRLDQLNPSCVTHSSGVNVIVFTSADVRRFGWAGSASIRPPRAVDLAVRDGLFLLYDTLADAGVR